MNYIVCSYVFMYLICISLSYEIHKYVAMINTNYI